MTEDVQGLYADLAVNYLATNSAEYTFPNLVEIGKSLFDKHRADIELAVRSSDRVQSSFAASQRNEETYSVLAAISETVATLSTGLSPLIVAKLCVAVGLESMFGNSK